MSILRLTYAFSALFWAHQKGVKQMNIEQQIAADLDLCDMIAVFGNASAKRKARAHRKACFAAIAEINKADGFGNLSDDELLAELIA
jgi:hypothetical protein